MAHRQLPALLSLLPTLVASYLLVEDACPIFDGQGALGFGRQIRSTSKSFAWTSAGSEANTYPTNELDADGNEIMNTAMSYTEIADYWCIVAGYTGHESFTPIKGKRTSFSHAHSRTYCCDLVFV
jgi:hypothetical protein